MSLYQVQKVMFLLKKDEQLAQAIKQTPSAALAPFPLSDEERAALGAGDLAALYRMGVHPLLLAPYSRVMGISRPDYCERLAPVRGYRTLQSTQGDTL